MRSLRCGELERERGSYADLSRVYGYDSLNRLISANLAAGQTQSFTYDANSNRTNATINAASTTYTYPYPSTSHKLSSLSGAITRSFTYDNAGNTISTLGVTYTYDGRGRMKQAGTTTYLVNGLGQRVKKSSSGDTYFAYDEAGRLIGEYDTSGAPIQETVWVSDVPIAVLKPAQPSGFTLFYVWADHLGTPRQITDTSNVSRWEWAHDDPFGNNAPNENPAGAGTFSFNLRFPGQYFDSEIGTHYNYFRDYDPRIGRYVESDPIGLLGGLLTYGYTRTNPIRSLDELGLFDVAWKPRSFDDSRRPPEWVQQLRRMGQRLEDRIKALCARDRDLLQPYFDKWTVEFDPTKINPWTLNSRTKFSPDFFRRDDSYKIFLHEFRHTMDDNQKLRRRSYLGSYLSGSAKDEPDEIDADAFAHKLGNTCLCPDF